MTNPDRLELPLRQRRTWRLLGFVTVDAPPLLRLRVRTLSVAGQGGARSRWLQSPLRFLCYDLAVSPCDRGRLCYVPHDANAEYLCHHAAGWRAATPGESGEPAA